jgi:hypothetical protein
LDTIEDRELPGNDASWFRALLEEYDRPEPPAEPEPGSAAEKPAAPAPEPAAAPTPDPVATDESEDETNVATPAEDPVPEAVADSSSTGTLLVEPIPPEPEAPVHGDDDDSVIDFRAGPPPAPVDLVRSPETTSETVGRMWESQDSGGPLDDWAPEAMDRAISSRRTFRWTSLILAVLAVTLVAVALVLLPSIARSRANDRRQLYRDALSDLRNELPDTQTSLAIATDPGSDLTEIQDRSTELTQLASYVSGVEEATQLPLPTAPPLTSKAPINDLEPIRSRLEPIATNGLTIQRRISNLVSYRSLLGSFLQLPELPTAADSAQQSELRVALAAANAESASVLSELPSDVALDDHHAQARALSERFADWQVEYLEALRTEDVATAQTLVAELETSIADLNNALVTPLAQIRRQVDDDIITLASSIDDVATLITG